MLNGELTLVKTSCLIAFLLFTLISNNRVYSQTHAQDTIVAYLIKAKNQLTAMPTSLTKEQKGKIDSLTAKIDELKGKNDSLLVNTYDALSVFYAFDLKDFKKGLALADSILTVAKANSNNYFYSVAYRNIADAMFDKANYVESLLATEKSLGYLEKSGVSKFMKTKHMGRAYNSIGAIVTNMNDNERSIANYLKGIELAEMVADTSVLKLVYYNLSYIFSDMNEWQKSLDYSRKSLQYITSDKWLDVIILSRTVYLSIKVQKIDDVSQLLKQAEKYKLKFPNHFTELSLQNAKGVYYRYLGKKSKAEEHLIKAYKEAVLYEDPYWIAIQSRELGLFHFQYADYLSSRYFFDLALDVATNFGYQPQAVQLFDDLSELTEAQGYLKEALSFKEKRIFFSDSLVKKQNHNRILFSNAKFESDKKQNEITQLQKGNEIKNLTIEQSRLWLYLAIVTAITLAIVGLLTYRNLKHKQNIARQNEALQAQQISALEKDKQLVLADAILKGQEQERGRLAKDLHDGLGGLLSGVKISLSNMKSNMVMTSDNVLVFERSLDMLDNSIQELRRVSHNMMPESLVKFGLSEALRDFCESINSMKALVVTFQTVGVERKLDSSQEIILYRIVQELINNSLKHSGAQNALIQFMFEPSLLSITVEDDGNGFEKSLLESTVGSGWANIKSRVEYLKGKLDVTTQPGEGTSIHIELPL